MPPVQTEFHIGIDDTDSMLGGCTTYTAALLFRELESKGFKPIDFPSLIRLNPNIPWKTRGNGALSLHFSIDNARLPEAKETALSAVTRTADLSQKSTDPAVGFLTGPVTTLLREFADRALHDIISVREARQTARIAGVEVHLLKGSRGMVGALAAIGADLTGDHTFEILAYRTSENIGAPRRVSHDSIRQMDKEFRRLTFNNVDPETGRILVCPHGPDPVLLGIRGENPETVTRAIGQVCIDEKIERTMIFKSNQGTDAHLKIHRAIASIRRYQSVVINGRVQQTPRMIRGGHVVFRVEDDTSSIDCAAYRQTGSMRDVSIQLVPGDLVTVSGGVHSACGELTVNVEKLEITVLANVVQLENPNCPICGGRCESMGKEQGLRCKKCKARFPRTLQVKKLGQRKIQLGVYLPPPRAQRHLTKPLSRYGVQDHSMLKISKSHIDHMIGSSVLTSSTV